MRRWPQERMFPGILSFSARTEWGESSFESIRALDRFVLPTIGIFVSCTNFLNRRSPRSQRESLERYHGGASRSWRPSVQLILVAVNGHAVFHLWLKKSFCDFWCFLCGYATSLSSTFASSTSSGVIKVVKKDRVLPIMSNVKPTHYRKERDRGYC